MKKDTWTPFNSTIFSFHKNQATFAPAVLSEGQTSPLCLGKNPSERTGHRSPPASLLDQV